MTQTNNIKENAELKTGYKKTKLGWIPNEWEVVQLREIGVVLNGLTYSPDDVTENGLLVLRSSNIQNHQLSFLDNVYVSNVGIEYNPVFENDILICVRNGSKNLIGKNILIPKELEGAAFGAFMTVFRSEKNNYLAHVFNSSVFKKSVHMNLGATINSINNNDLRKYKIPLPPLPEQQKIATILSTWDKAIDKLNRLISAKEQRKKGLMQLLLTGEARLCDENGKRFEGEWKEVKLGEVLTIGSGKDYKHLNEGCIPVYGTGGVMTFVDDFLYDGESVGIGRKGTIDKPQFLIGKFWTVDTLFYTHSFKNGEPKYFFHLFLTINWKLYNEASGVPSLSKNTIENILVKLPSLQEQQKIASVLSAADKEIELLKRELKALEQQKQGLMQVLLTGEVRVKNFLSLPSQSNSKQK